MIIHILGPHGSGKSLLGKKIKDINNVVIIETNEINIFNKQQILKKVVKNNLSLLNKQKI